MKKIIFIILCSFYLTLNVYALDWDLLDEDCAGIGDWTSFDDGGATTTQVTFDSLSTFKFNVPAATNGDAQVGRTVNFPDAGFTYEARFRVENYATTNGNFNWCPYNLMFGARTASKHNYRFEVGYDGTNYFLKTRPTNDAADYLLYMLDLSPGGWHTIRIVVEASRVVTVWIDDRVIVPELTWSRTSALSANYTNLALFGWGAGSEYQLAYVDYVKVDTTPEHSTSDSPLKIGTEDIGIRYRQDGEDDGYTTAYDYTAAEKLRMYDGTDVLSVPLVATGHGLVSKVRIYDGSNVKSLMKLPN